MSQAQFSPYPSGPSISTAVTPTLPLLGVTEDEARTLGLLRSRVDRDRGAMLLEQAYYLGEYIVQNLRIAIPKELEFLRTVLGWPSLAVDPYVERLFADGFIVGDGTDSDQRIGELLDANAFASEQSLAFTDALSMRRSYWMVGSNPEKGGPPVITVESPLNMSVLWDLRGTSPRAAIQEYWDADNRRRGALVMPKKTVHLAENDQGQWEVFDRDEHGFDFVPVIRMANLATTNNRDGRSAITPAIRSITDTACRTLLGLEVSREIYSVPQMILLGVTESAFQKSDGTPKTALETYMTSVLAIERDENGDLPEIHQKTVYDPATFTKILDWCASNMGSNVAAPPQDLGLYTQGNPASAEAGTVAEGRRDRRAQMQQRQFGTSLIKVAQMALRFENNGTLPEEFARMAVDWAPITVESPTSDGITKQIASGAVPATSDVVLKRLGYDSAMRRRMSQDRSADDARQMKQALAAAFLPKQSGGVGG
jgi:hypothetical protein